LSLGPFEYQNLDISNEKYDLVFVDGHGDSRPETVNYYFGKCDTIVAHDYETPSYRWDLIQQPESYIRVVYDKKNPFTVIFTKDESIKNVIF
jgi:hypothetical protein